MDLSSSDLEFFDFKDSSDEEIKEIQAILKGPGSNGCVELPWELSVKSHSVGAQPEIEGLAEATLAFTDKPAKSFDPCPSYAQSPAGQLPPAVEAFVTTVGPYQNAPYFVSRTIPYLRAYPPMGVPFFAFPQGTAGQFVPVDKPDGEPASETGDESDKDVPEPVALCPSSLPIVPLPPTTFAVAGYPSGLHTLPYPGQATPQAMYYVPVFNHPYGGYVPSPPMMMPETTIVEEGKGLVETFGKAATFSPVATDCESLNVQPECRREGEATPPAETTVPDSSFSSAEPLSSRETFGDCSPKSEAPSPCLRETVTSIERQAKVGERLPKTLESNPCPSEPVVLETKVVEVPSEECLSKTAPSNHCPSEPVVRRGPEKKVVEVPSEECLSKTVPLNCPSGPVVPERNSVDECHPKTNPQNDSLPEPVASPGERVPKTVPSNRGPPQPVVRDSSRCWADLFKGEVNGIHPPKQRNALKGDIANGKTYSVNHH